MLEKLIHEINIWGWQNWAVVIFYLALTTVVGELLKGKQATIRDLFLGGRKLPWWAVSASIIATELSAVTFLIVPVLVFKPGGNFKYLQLAIGTIIARFIIGYLFVPAYYKKEIYSPYQYMGMRLGPRVDRLTSIIFFVGAILAQGVRVYVTAMVLNVVLHINYTVSIILIAIFSITWTIMGGITTVIWTDFVQFFIFAIGGVVALIFAAKGIDGGFTSIFSEAAADGKFTLLDFSISPKKAYTIWCGIFGTTFLTLASHGTDQMIAQRMFCCKNEKEARKAIIWSCASQIMTILMLFVGAALYVFFKHHPLTGDWLNIYQKDPKTIFPIFIVKYLPMGISGLLIAGVFAAAISSLDSTLAAMAQTTISAFYKPFIKPQASHKHYVNVSRFFIIFWGIALSLMAFACIRLEKHFPDLVQLALAMTSYTYGALLGCLFLALFPIDVDDRGLIWAVPLSILFVLGMSWHNMVMNSIIFIALIIEVILGFIHLRGKEFWKNISIWIIVVIIFLINNHYTIHESILQNGKEIAGKLLSGGIYIPIISDLLDLITNGKSSLVSFIDLENLKSSGKIYEFFEWAWPWNFPAGCAITFFLGWFLGRKKTRNKEFEYEYDENGILKKQ